MNKKDLHQTILGALQNVLDTAVNAAKQAHETATHSETVAENKYDTFGLEASYLAEGQSKRVAQAESDWQQFEKLAVKNFDEDSAINYGAFVSLKSSSGSLQHVFLSPVAGGLSVMFEQQKVLLVSGQAPLGKALLGAYLDDEVTIGDQLFEINALS